VEQFERIRRDSRDEGMSIRALAKVHKVHRRTVRQALASATPPLRKAAPRSAAVLGPWLTTITGWLEEDLSAAKKQRHTGRRMWERLVEEYGAQLAESTVTHAVGRIRRELTPGQLLGRKLIENPQFIALRSHYGYDSFFCQAGIAGAHEKGGVEGEIGRFRRRWLTLLPVFATLAKLNEYIVAGDAKDDGQISGNKPATVGALFAAEAAALRPLPAGRFDAA
jgi:hypothetical protein